MTRDDDRFDRAMRELHRESLAHLDPDTLRRLRAARCAATATPSRRFGWPLASAVAAVFVLAVALPLRSPPTSVPPAGARDTDRLQTATRERATAAQRASQAVEQARADVPVGLTALEETPDFYLWLASNEAAFNALE